MTIMRKTLLYTLAAAFATILLAGCVKDEPINAGSVENGGQQYATFTFTPNFTDADGQTRTMALNPNDPSSPTGSQVRNIYFAVFDAAGYKLSEYAEAVPNSYATENGVAYSYSVKLSVTNEKRVIHIIANAPQRLPYGSEEEVIGGLMTYLNAPETGEFDRQEAYWERIELDGVFAEPDPQLQTDAPAQYAEQYAKYRGIVEKLSTAQLTRNFCQISLVNGATGNFEVTGFWLTNVPDRGSIAPYNRNEGKFQQNYAHWKSISKMMGSDTSNDEGNYQGFTPAGTEIVGIDDLTDAEIAAQMIAPGNSAFCYEREIPKSKPLYIIVGGKYNGSTTTTYYKIDLKDDEGEYFPIMRNFNYRINIESVKRAGASTVKGALAAAPSGDISTNLDLEDLTNISNGDAQIFVTETERVIVGESEIQLRYKFIPDLNATGQPAANTPSTTSADHSDHNSYVTIERKTVDGSAPVFYPTTTGTDSGLIIADSDDTSGDYRLITLKPYTPDDIVKTEEIIITGYYWDSTLSKWETISRTVTYKLRKKLEMELSCNPVKIANLAEQAIDVDIALEPGLPSSIFSLDMNIESNGLALTPNNDLIPVTSDYSTIPGKTSKPSFYYTKTITWTEYVNAPIGTDGKKHFICHFKTNKAVTSADQIYVSNHYFNQANTSYTTFTPKSFSSLTLSSSKVGESTNFAYTLSAVPSDGKVRIGLYGYEPSSTETDLTYVETVTEGGLKYEVYEMSVTSTTGNNFDITGYRKGDGRVILWADEFLESSKAANITSASLSIYANVDGTGSGDNWITLTGADVTSHGCPVVGQKSTLTFYVPVDMAATTVKVNTTTVTRASGTPVNIDGVDYYKYTMYYTPTARGMQEMRISVDDTPVDAFDVPVYGLSISSESIGGTAPATDTWYVFYNVGRSRWAYNNGSTLALTNITPDYSNLMKFSSTSTSTTVFNALANKYVVGTNNNFSFGNTGTTYTRGSSGSYMRLSYYKSNNPGKGTYYWRGTDSSTMSMNTSTNSNHSDWNVYSVAIVSPTE